MAVTVYGPKFQWAQAVLPNRVAQFRVAGSAASASAAASKASAKVKRMQWVHIWIH